MPEVEIEDYETKQVTREGYACDVCDRGMVDEPLQEDDVRGPIKYEADVEDRMERYKELITFTARLGSSVLLLAGMASATAIAALLFEVAKPGFVTDPALAGTQWLLAIFFILVGSMAGDGIIWWLEDNS